MKKTLTAFVLVCAMLLSVVGMAAAAGSYTPGTYTAEAKGMGGTVTVTVTVSEDAITAVEAAGPDETPGVGVPALDVVANALLEAQSVDVDGVTGATVTSTAVKTAAAAALAEAAGETVDKGNVPDGTYTGKAPSFGVMKEMELAVTFKDNAIVSIETICAGSATQADEEEYSNIYATVEQKLYPRIIEAQSLDVDAICGATVSSNAAKTILRNVIDANGGNSAGWDIPVEKSTEVVELRDYDVIVVGLGSSGVASFLSAAENGCTVFGMDAAGKIGGNGTNTAGPLGVNPAAQVANNGGENFVDPDELYDAWMEYCEDDAKGEIVKMFIDESGETFGWLADNYDFAFLPSMFSFYDSHGWKLWTMYSGKDGGSKDDAYLAAMDKAVGYNEKNEYKTELRATSLIQEDGKVVGVEAVSYDGTVYRIYGDSVVLADGGFIGNAEMTTKYTGAVWHTKGMTQCNGFGISQALALGGALYNPDVAVEDHIAALDNIIRSDDYSNDDKSLLTSLVLDLNYQMIDSKGLINEAEYNSIKENGLISFNMPMFFGQGGTYTEGTPVSNLDDIMEMGKKFNDVIVADSLADLSEQLGIDIALEDVHGQTEGKIYCIKGAAYVYSTCGGLDIDTNLNLLLEDGTPVENIFVVGNNSLGTLNASNKAYVLYGGAAQGWALTSGRLVGKIAAERFAG
mgnify:CR=1 FL=1